jgi:carboxypeptidase family protein
MGKLRGIIPGVALAAWLVPALAAAQVSAGAIAGTVRDATGAVLPGVTVEATSPALIEKVRTTVSDAEGQYRIVDLRPGVYTVTFSLTGFSTVRREGIELTTEFTAAINAEMRVGSIEETITVSGDAPVVDVQNVTQRQILTRDVIESLPTAKGFMNFAALVPGMVLAGSSHTLQDVGGASGQGFVRVGIHGGLPTDQQLYEDGYSINNLSTDGGSTNGVPIEAGVQEYILETSGRTAETETGGVRINTVPREGGNSLSGTGFFNFSHPKLQAHNYSDELRARGLRDPNKLKELWASSGGVGGPIKQNKAWFFVAAQRTVTDNYLAGLYINRAFERDPRSWFYEPDETRQALWDQRMWAVNGRVTWQVSQRQRVNMFKEYNYLCNCHFTSTSTLTTNEAADNATFKNHKTQLTWTMPVTNQLLLQAGYGDYFVNPWFLDAEPEIVALRYDPNPPYQKSEQSSGITYGGGDSSKLYSRIQNIRSSVSYVTGTHNLKVGIDMRIGSARREIWQPGNAIFRLNQQRPNQVTYVAGDRFTTTLIRPNAGFYAQDQWTTRSLTLNLGLRLDWYRSRYPEQFLPKGGFRLVDYNFPGGGAINWKDLNPRLGAAYDLFGRGKTAFKWNLGRYNRQQASQLTDSLNPVNAGFANTVRTWNDMNNDFIVQGDPLNPNVDRELGRGSNQFFGTPVISTRIDPEYARGWHVREYNWEMSAGVQHELLRSMAISTTYFRRWFGNFQLTDNLAFAPSDYDPYCVTAPRDSRLPDGGGQQICDLYDIRPEKLGQLDNMIRTSSFYGKQIRQWQGFDILVNARPASGFILQGGLSSGRTLLDNCDIVTKVDNPSTYLCRTVEPMIESFKMLGSYVLPWDIQIAATVQNNPPPEIIATTTFSNAAIFPSLKRNLAAGSTANVSINTVPPGTKYGDRMTQIDLRLGKTFTYGARRVYATFDMYNVLNGNNVLSQNNTFGTTGSSWLVPTSIVPARLLKFEVRYSF